MYRQLYEIAMQCALLHVREVVKRRQLCVTFLTFSAAEWQAESVFRRLERDTMFSVRVVVAPMTDRAPEVRKQTYQETLRFFESNQYPVTGGYDPETDRCFGWNDLGDFPDIVFHLSSWYSSIPKQLSLTTLPLRCLNFYIPYCMYIPENIGQTYLRDAVYNLDFVNLMYRVYTDSPENLKGYREYEVLGGDNVRYSGFPKMDRFFSDTPRYTEEEISALWKIPRSSTACKKVIIAPHHSMSPQHMLRFSTFPDNAHALLQLARDYGDKISFVFKPHPNVRARVVSAGVFASLEEYDAYIAQWNALPNARVVTEGDYLELFATSDAMIMDSASFVGEYLYVDKPLLFLTREGQAFSALGEKLMEAHYRTAGTDIDGIRDFLEQVVLGGKDEKAADRRRVFSECLDYPRHNGCLAGEFIYKEIRQLISDGQEDE